MHSTVLLINFVHIYYRIYQGITKIIFLGIRKNIIKTVSTE
jgi:hypothetical protein